MAIDTAWKRTHKREHTKCFKDWIWLVCVSTSYQSCMFSLQWPVSRIYFLWMACLFYITQVLHYFEINELIKESGHDQLVLGNQISLWNHIYQTSSQLNFSMKSSLALCCRSAIATVIYMVLACPHWQWNFMIGWFQRDNIWLVHCRSWQPTSSAM